MKKEAPSPQPFLREPLFCIHYILAAIIIFAGGIYTYFSLRTMDRNLRQDLLNQARLIASSINTNRLKDMPEESSKRGTQRLQQQLIILKHAFPDIRLLYLMGKTPFGSICVHADEDSPGESHLHEAGETTCAKISPRLGLALHQGEEIVLGPFEDQWGDWFSAAVPVLDQLTGEALAGLAIDITAAAWREKMRHGALPGICITLIFLLILSGSAFLHYKNQFRSATYRKNLVLILAMLIGLIFSFFLAWRIHCFDRQQQDDIFQQLGENTTALVAKNINFIRVSELEGLAGFLSHRENITSREFKIYTSHLTKNSLVQSWEWVVILPDSERNPFEDKIRQLDEPNFLIWEYGANGDRVPAGKRPVYYPILFYAPEKGNEKVLGFDMGSEKKRQAALKEALATGLGTATEPVTLVQEWADERSMVILHPVFQEGTENIRGFALATIRGEMLFGRDLSKVKLAHLKISFLRSDGTREILADSKRGKPCLSGPEVIRPVFAFGQVLSITATPCREFYTAYPQYRSLAVLFGGILLTAAATTITALISGRGAALSILVAERTANLSKSEEHFHLLAAQTKTVQWECTPDGLYLDIAPEALTVFGFQPGELIGKQYFYDLHPPLGREQFREHILKTFASGEAFTELINPVLCKDGRMIIVSTSGMPLFDRQGTLIGFYGSDRDVTEREQLITELEQNRKAAESANHSKSEFLTNMSHEIRTPINGIIGVADLLISSTLNDEQRDYLEIIQTSSQMLLTLINEILDFSRIEAGRITLITTDFDLRRLLEDVAGNLAFAAHSKNLELYCTLEPAFPPLFRGDEFHLRQILTNLVGNAIKFTDEGEVCISACIINEQANKPQIRFSIRDTGIGIPADQKKHVFETFFQADSSNRRRHGGTGLGLSIVRKLVEFMGGEIRFNSQLNEGTEFFFSLPFTGIPSAPESVREIALEIRKNPVLLVDSFPGTRMELKNRLQAMGIPAESAGDLVEAEKILQTMADAPCATVILDLNLPEFYSENTLPYSLTPELWNKCRCVGLTHLKSGLDITKFHFLRLQGILHKPVKTTELLNALNCCKREIPPIDSTPTEPPARLSQAVADSAPAKSILLAEDNSVNQKVALALLKKLGLRADVASNGLEALALLAKNDYALVLMDVQMPEMDGLEAAKRIREPGSGVKNPRIPIIAVTAHAVTGYKDSCLAAGMDDYLSKPIRVQQLKELLERWLNPLP